LIFEASRHEAARTFYIASALLGFGCDLAYRAVLSLTIMMMRKTALRNIRQYLTLKMANNHIVLLQFFQVAITFPIPGGIIRIVLLLSQKFISSQE